MKIITPFVLLMGATFLFSCSNQSGEKKEAAADSTAIVNGPDTFNYATDKFADIRVLRYQIPGFEELTSKQKELLYYLYEAALCGRDIYWDQNYKYNLTVRKTIETIVSSYKGDKSTDDWNKFMVYAKRVWFSSGIHHHYSSDKIFPDCSKEYFTELIKNSNISALPINQGENTDAFIQRITPIIFDKTVAPKKVSLDSKHDLLQASANNFYEGVSEKEASAFYKAMETPGNNTPVMYGLNSKLIKENGKLVEKVWKVGGMYSSAIEKIVYWLEKASTVAENDNQKKALDLLIEYFKTGDLKKFDEYCIAWVADTASVVDVVNGYIEVYGDPLGKKGNYESVVSIKDFEASKRIAAIGAQAQWFEDNSPLMPEHKKKNVKGISAKVITVVQESGDAAPSTPIGINLPNSNWIRQQHGSKSVNLGNIVYAYEKAKSASLIDEFYINPDMNKRVKEFGAIAGALHTDMHEVIGHASGQINEGVGNPSETLKNYANALEEARADLVALFYVTNQKLVDIGVMPSVDCGKAEYDGYITNGLMIQLARLKLGDNLEEAHMRNRQLVAKWCYEKGKKDNVIEMKKSPEGKTYVMINDYEKLHTLFGELLREIQRIKSEGDYNAGKNLIETYGVKVDHELHKEVLERYSKLDVAPYQGFIQPKLVSIMEGGKITDVKVQYPYDFVQQMLEYGKNYGFLPTIN